MKRFPKYILYYLLIIILHTGTAFSQKKVFSISDYGAKADGKTSNTLAIQQAIDQAAVAGGTVLIPAGKFITGVIRLKSNVELHLEDQAELLATTRRIDYGAGSASALIVANRVHHIAITGKGTINGQADLLIKDIYSMLKAGTLKDSEWQQYNDWHQMRPEERNRPKLIEFKNCDQIILTDFTIRDGLCWIQDYRDCTNMVIDHISVISNTYLNNDGIDLVDCKNVKLTNSFFNVADDGVCLKSSNPKSFCENITITDCKIRSSASAFKMGTASRGGFKKITVSNLTIYDTFRSAIAIETVDGGDIDQVDIRNVTATNTGNALFIRLGKRNKKAEPGRLENVYIANVKVEVPADKPDAGYSWEGPAELFAHNTFPSSIAGIPGHPVKNVTIEDVEITYAGGIKKDVPLFGIDSLEKIPENSSAYPEFSMFGELPVSGLYVRHASGIKLKNIAISYLKEEPRTVAAFDDVHGLDIDGLMIPQAGGKPVILLHKVTQQNLKNIKLPDHHESSIQIK